MNGYGPYLQHVISKPMKTTKIHNRKENMSKLFLGIIFSLISGITFGQFTSLTPKIGLTWSVFYQKATVSKFTPGFLFGISSNYKLTENLSIKPEIIYEEKCSKMKGIIPDEDFGNVGNWENKINLSYLNLPLFIKYNFGKRNHGLINGGIYFGYLLKMTNHNKGIDNGEYFDEKFTHDLNVYNRFDFGIGIGGGKIIPVGKKNGVLIELRYNFALTSPNIATLYPKQHTIGLNLGYMFGVNRNN